MSPSCPWLVSQARARLVPSSIFEDNRESYISRLCRCSFLCKFPFFCFQFPFLSCFLLPAFPVAHWYPPCHLLLLSSITGVVLCFTHKSSSSSFLYSSLTMLSSCTSCSSISISELVVIYWVFSQFQHKHPRPQCLPLEHRSSTCYFNHTYWVNGENYLWHVSLWIPVNFQCISI